ncbi:MAG: DUF2089 family protein [Candidatus Auribacterota bacterium]|nr:DUF2089 family protein [Candidatus Auribacterota bacterium]
MKQWTDYLEEEDLAFLKRFILASGSLKEIARIYGISYPTVRLRLDRLIKKIRVIDSLEEIGPFEERLRLLYADGKIDLETLRILRQVHREGGERQ